MIKITLAVQQIYSLAFPTPGSGEFHGLPKEYTEAADNPNILVVDIEHPHWDFNPWFLEKVNMIKGAFKLKRIYIGNAGALAGGSQSVFWRCPFYV